MIFQYTRVPEYCKQLQKDKTDLEDALHTNCLVFYFSMPEYYKQLQKDKTDLEDALHTNCLVLYQDTRVL